MVLFSSHSGSGPLTVLFTLSLLARAVGAEDTGVAQGNRSTGRFKTEPSFARTYFALDFVTEEPQLLFDGYIFIDPVHGAPTMGLNGDQHGPQIREPDGTLVWYGGVTESYDSVERERTRIQDFGPCDFMGERGTHLCWSEKLGRQKRKHVVVDSKYGLTMKLYTELDHESPNMHEFNLVDNGNSYVQAVWPQRSMDLTPYGGPKEGKVFDACIQDVSLLSNLPVFRWCWMENFPVWETMLFPAGGPNTTNTTSMKVGSGSLDDPWDAWHLNAVDKNDEGDYLVSVRHDDQILKIAGNNNTAGLLPGTVIWRLGGKGSTVSVVGDAFRFSKQHGVRFISTTRTETTFSILDNAWEGALAPSFPSSSGMIISVNNETMTARMLRRYISPTADLAPSQGNVQLLPNNNVFVSWGSKARFTEYSHEGRVLYHASYTNATGPVEGEYYSYSYRVFKASWRGEPSWKPKLVVYSRTCKPNPMSPLVAWVSWNGATEVKSWRFTVSDGPAGPWVYVGTWSKEGFETQVILSDSLLMKGLSGIMFPHYISVEALDAHGRVLSFQTTETFVPARELKKTCGALGCAHQDTEGFDYYDMSRTNTDVCSVRKSLIPNVIVLVLLLGIVEYITYFYRVVAGAAWSWKKASWMDKMDGKASWIDKLEAFPLDHEGYLARVKDSPPASFEEVEEVPPIAATRIFQGRRSFQKHRQRPSFQHIPV